MRKGVNPQKKNIYSDEQYTHQVVIPVCLPNQEGYFKDGFKIFQACLLSLINTIHNKTFITIVNNGSSKEVVKYLNLLLLNNEIHEVVHTTNIGKINAILKAIKGHYFEVITIADADTFFLSNWQNEVAKVFNAFPKAGVVGIVPQFKLYAYLCSNVLFDNFFSKRMKFTKVVNPDAMKHFYKSIEWDDNYNQDMLKVQLTLEDDNNNFRAIVGSGHFVATYRNIAFKDSPTYQVTELLGSKSDHDFLDYPILKKGGWRLTTEDNYAYHMGNVYEEWMEDELKKLKISKEYLEIKSKNFSSNKLSHFIKNKLFSKLSENKIFINTFIKYKGLPKAMTKTPWHY